MTARTRSRAARRLLGAALLALAVVVVPAGAATASGPASGPVPAGVSAVGGVDDFTFDSFDVHYTLGRDDQQRSTLTTSETLVAVFPPNQNRGIRRYIPSTYLGHPTHVDIVSVQDESGRDRDYETSFESDDSGSYMVLTIAVPEGQYVQGIQTYVITYTQRDVTNFFADANDDEFYWDTNGTGWAQPFGEVSATLTLDDGLAEALTGVDCYYGSSGSTTQCESATDGDTVTASVQDLGPYSNMTIVAAFPAGTFAAAPFDIFAWVPLPVFIGIGLMLLATVVALVMRFTTLRGARGTGIVVAQYEPADDVSALLAANLVGKTKKGMAAAIVDLAVRRKIRIIERPDEGFFASGTTFGVQPIDDTGLSADDQKVVTALFASYSLASMRDLMRRGNPPGLIVIGQQAQAAAAAGTAQVEAAREVRWLTKKDTTLGQRVVAITKAVAADALRRGLRTKPRALPIIVVALMLVAGFLFMLFGGFTAQTDIGIMVGVLGTILASWIGVGALIMLGSRRPLTREGALAVEHLEGLREYIKLAEADRLQMLQSVSGAERVATDAGSVVKIYERLLPYAVLFGLEKEWAGELAKYYDETPPDWYSGSNISAFNVGVFAGAIGSLSSSVSSSYSGSAGSSSSGGSGGGGSSGGGGGGGGGGGV